MFFALRGENTDGNKYVKNAFDKGAAYAVVDDASAVLNERCIKVDDTLQALQQLAKQYRATFSFPVFALTGSNGKTTTKELITAVLSTQYNTSATKGNLNNHIGVPLTILSVAKDAEFAIIEMGANHQHEIEFLCSIADPQHGLITNIGKAHLDGFGGIEGVKKGKSELFRYVMEHNGTLFANSSEKMLTDVYEGYEKVITYGIRDRDNTTGVAAEGKFASVTIDNKISIASNLAGDYNIPNILAAACVGKFFGISYENIKKAVENYFPDNNRSEYRHIGNNYFILDAYNANPSSVQAALGNFEKIQAETKIVILGDMLELGIYSEAEHRNILQEALQKKFSKVIIVGPKFGKLKNAGADQWFATAEEAAQWLREQNYNEAIILVKGSRKIGLEKIAEQLR